jgi:hypothetical protein
MKELTNTVYGLIKGIDTNTKTQKQRSNRQNNAMNFDYLEVINAYEFELELDIPLIGYFEKEDDKPLKLEAIIAGLDLVTVTEQQDPHPDYYSHYAIGILILSKGDIRYGFIGSLFRNESMQNYIYDGKISFQSFGFLSGNSVVHYYEDGETIYIFNMSFDSNQLIEIDLIQSYVLRTDAGVEGIDTYHPVTIVEDSYKRIEPQYAYDFINEVNVKMITIEATVMWIEGNIAHISSKEYQSLKSVTYNNIVDKYGNIIDGSGQYPEFGSIVEVFIYLRHPQYKPVDIRIYELKVIKF